MATARLSSQFDIFYQIGLRYITTMNNVNLVAVRITEIRTKVPLAILRARSGFPFTSSARVKTCSE